MPPSLDDHFLPTSIIGLLRRGHPYDFGDTYRSLQILYGYKAAYVNLGLWPNGELSPEPGRALTMAVAAPLQLQAGETLIDAGSGLGQGAVDLASAFALGRVIGVNPNQRQVAFATELANSMGESVRVRFEIADACTWLNSLSPGSIHGVMAVECIGHFPRPESFFAATVRALMPGRRLAFCLNVSLKQPTWLERIVFATSFGFVPSSPAKWQERLREAGFVDTVTVDLTPQVTGALCEVVQSRLADGGSSLDSLSRTTRLVAVSLQWFTRRAVRDGRLGYVLIHAAAPDRSA